MKKRDFAMMIRNWRYYAIVVTMMIILFGALSVPSDGLNVLTWVVTLLVSKITALAAFIGLISILKTWVRQNKVPELVRYMAEIEE